MGAKTTLECFALILIIFVAVVPTTQSQLTENQGLTKGNPNCICTDIYAPVCGSDGKTYPSKCRFNCDKPKGVKCLCNGACICDDETGCTCSPGAPPCPST